MKDPTRRNKRSLSLLLLMFLSIFSMAGLLSVKDVQADETWRGTPGSYRTWRMGNIEKELKEIKSKLEALALRKEGYIKSNADNIRSRLTKKYNEDVAALDQELVDDYNRYKAHVTTRTITLSGTATDMNRGDNGTQSIYINSSLADSGSTATDKGTANWSEELNLSSGTKGRWVKVWIRCMVRHVG